jgi:hypothetical protein
MSLHDGDPSIASLLTFGELALGGNLLLNLGAIAINPQSGLRSLAGIAPVRINVRTGIGLIERGLKNLTVMNSISVGVGFVDPLRKPFCIHREIVAKINFAMLSRSSGVRILLPAFRGLSVCGRGTLVSQRPLLAADMLLWSRNRRCFIDLTSAGQIPLTKQVGVQVILRTRVESSVLLPLMRCCLM